jgi:hypothetical protein
VGTFSLFRGDYVLNAKGQKMSLVDAFLEEGLSNPPPYASATGVRREIFVAIRTDGVIGAGTIEDPYNGSTDDLLDALLRDITKVPTNMTVRFGPGTFQTKGAGGFITGFRARTGQRFIGSGIGQTTLQLVKLTAADDDSYAVGGIFGNPVPPATSDILISDMTLDCNLSRQPRKNGANNYNPDDPPGNISITNFIAGANTVFRRLRVINWGPHIPSFIYYKPQIPPMTNPLTLKAFPFRFQTIRTNILGRTL